MLPTYNVKHRLTAIRDIQIGEIVVIHNAPKAVTIASCIFNAICLSHDILWSLTTLWCLPCDVLVWNLDATCLAMNTAGRGQYDNEIWG